MRLIPMSDSNSEALGSAGKLVEQIAVELVFAEPGNDVGLLPINCHLGDLNAIVESGALPAPLTEGISEAGIIIDQIFEEGAVFSDDTLAKLNNWLAWAQAACSGEVGETPAAPAAEAPLVQDNTPAAPAETAAADEAAEQAIILDLEEDGELLQEFINESREHLENIETGVLDLENNPEDADTINSIFRAFHTFKGGAGFLNLMPIKELAHQLEDLLDQVRSGNQSVDLRVISVILKGGDTLSQFVGEIEPQLNGQSPVTPIQIPIVDLVAEVRGILAGEPAKTPAAIPSSEPEVDPEAPVADIAEEPSAAAPTTPSTPAPQKAPSSSRPQSARPTEGSTVKVATDKLDSLVNLVGEIVVAQSMVAMDAETAVDDSGRRTRNFSMLRRATRELQRVAMSMRMVPVQGCFSKMKRLIRDVAGKVGKEVDLVTSGGDTELDRTIVEQIGDPLIHMVRNSVDHGIESPEERMRAGKDSTGTVHLSARHQGGNIVIELRDDGAGLDRDRILAKALENGVIGPDQALTDREVYELIFAPGFSTAETVTDLSGRGVGMDVVRRNIETLHGKIEIDSKPGMGTVFSVHLPLTLAIIDGMMVSVAGQPFILPTLAVRESMRVTPDMVSRLRGRGELIDVRGQLIPLLRLHEHFGMESNFSDTCEGIVVVVESGQDVRCVLVDELIGKQEIVIKSLGDLFKSNRSLAGAAILGDGSVGLILDVNSLVTPLETELRIAA